MIHFIKAFLVLSEEIFQQKFNDFPLSGQRLQGLGSRKGVAYLAGIRKVIFLRRLPIEAA